MTTALLALVLAATIATTTAPPVAPVAPLPDAPQPLTHSRPRLDRTEWTLLAVDAAVRGLDAYSTHYMLTRGAHELVLPDLISHHTPAMIAFSGGMVGLQYLLARELGPRHRRLAHLATAIDIGVDAPGAIHNLFLKGSK